MSSSSDAPTTPTADDQKKTAAIDRLANLDKLLKITASPATYAKKSLAQLKALLKEKQRKVNENYLVDLCGEGGHEAPKNVAAMSDAALAAAINAEERVVFPARCKAEHWAAFGFNELRAQVSHYGLDQPQTPTKDQLQELLAKFHRAHAMDATINLDEIADQHWPAMTRSTLSSRVRALGLSQPQNSPKSELQKILRREGALLLEPEFWSNVPHAVLVSVARELDIADAENAPHKELVSLVTDHFEQVWKQRRTTLAQLDELPHPQKRTLATELGLKQGSHPTAAHLDALIKSHFHEQLSPTIWQAKLDQLAGAADNTDDVARNLTLELEDAEPAPTAQVSYEETVGAESAPTTQQTAAADAWCLLL